MNPKEWREKNGKRFTLKSGLEVVVRPLSPFRLMELGPIPKIEASDGEEYAQTLKRIVQAGLVSPSLGEGEDQVQMTDFTIEDANEIMDAILSITNRKEGNVPLADTGSSEAQPSS